MLATNQITTAAPLQRIELTVMHMPRPGCHIGYVMPQRYADTAESDLIKWYAVRLKQLHLQALWPCSEAVWCCQLCPEQDVGLSCKSNNGTTAGNIVSVPRARHID